MKKKVNGKSILEHFSCEHGFFGWNEFSEDMDKDEIYNIENFANYVADKLNGTKAETVFEQVDWEEIKKNDALKGGIWDAIIDINKRTELLEKEIKLVVDQIKAKDELNKKK